MALRSRPLLKARCIKLMSIQIQMQGVLCASWRPIWGFLQLVSCRACQYVRFVRRLLTTLYQLPTQTVTSTNYQHSRDWHAFRSCTLLKAVQCGFDTETHSTHRLRIHSLQSYGYCMACHHRRRSREQATVLAMIVLYNPHLKYFASVVLLCFHCTTLLHASTHLPLYYFGHHATTFHHTTSIVLPPSIMLPPSIALPPSIVLPPSIKLPTGIKNGNIHQQPHNNQTVVAQLVEPVTVIGKAISSNPRLVFIYCDVAPCVSATRSLPSRCALWWWLLPLGPFIYRAYLLTVFDRCWHCWYAHS